MSLYIALEGGEGGGKSTQSKRLAERLEQEGIPVRRTREPGGTRIGDQIRTLLFDPEVIPRTEVFLFQAARAQLIDTVIEPALQKGQVVISDRSYWSSVVYQGYGRTYGAQRILDMSSFATKEITPNRVYLLDIDPQIALGRKRAQREENKFEEEQLEFHNRLRTGFLEQAEKKSNCFRVLDATQPVEDLHQQIYTDFQQLRQG